MSRQNKTVVITGGTKGVGRATAEHLAGLGYNLALSYSLDDAAADETRATLDRLGAKYVIVKADSRHCDDIEYFFWQTVDQFGDIYAVIANAGIENVEAPFADMSEAELDKVTDINFKGTFLTLQQAARTVIDGGRVIATASMIASYPIAGAGAYVATKAAVRAMVDVLALELGERGITVNSLDPGAVEGAGIVTHMTDDIRANFAGRMPMGRLPTPADLVSAMEFLLSDGAQMVSGHHLAVTGGFRF